MQLKYYSKQNLKKEIIKIVSKHLDINQHKLFFFGSRVTGKSSERSDIDIGIKGKTPINISTLAQIREEIEELPILYSIDFVDFAEVSDKFNQVAEEKIEYIN